MVLLVLYINSVYTITPSPEQGRSREQWRHYRRCLPTFDADIQADRGSNFVGRQRKSNLALDPIGCNERGFAGWQRRFNHGDCPTGRLHRSWLEIDELRPLLPVGFYNDSSIVFGVVFCLAYSHFIIMVSGYPGNGMCGENRVCVLLPVMYGMQAYAGNITDDASNQLRKRLDLQHLTRNRHVSRI